MTPEALFSVLVASSIGFAVFVYGKKQTRPPQLVAGMVLMAVPFVLQDALWVAIATASVCGGLWFAIRAGW